MGEPRLAFYGDDFTGSVDVLLQLSRAGWRSRLLLALPAPADLARAARDVDAVGIAGIARSVPTGELEAEVRPALRALAALGPRVLQYKACSTADSSPQVGSLGRVLEIARELFGPGPTPVLFAQPDFGRYTAFGHHFAAEGGVVHRLDRQPTMAHHPVTPMTESDLARHLSEQTALPIGHVPFTDYGDAASLANTLAERAEAAVVLDALTSEHVDLVAAAVVAGAPARGPRFVLGSGGLSRGLGRALSEPADAPGEQGRDLNAVGPVLAVSGSRSAQTARQVDAAARAGWTVLPLPLGEDDPAGAVRDQVLDELGRGRSVVVASGDVDAGVGAADLVGRISGALATLVGSALQEGLTRRVIVCGGDTSSRLLRGIGAGSLSLAANPTGNVVLCTVGSATDWLDGAEILLKGGQVGTVNLFELVRTLGPPAAT